MFIGHEEVDDLALGSVVLGTGGGGDISLSKLMLHQAITTHGPVRVVDAGELDPTGLLLPVALVGASVGFTEKLINGGEAGRALQAMEEHWKRKGVAVLPLEVGGVNTLYPLVVAAELGLPCVDADTMRRAFPKIEMTQFTLAGITASPLIAVDVKGNVAVFDAVDNATAERFIRSCVVEMGMFAVMSCYSVTAKQCVDHAILGSMSYALEVGRRLSAIQRGDVGAWDEFLGFADAQILFSGKVVDIERRSVGGWTRGTVSLEQLDDASRTLRVDIQNENLIALEDGIALATVPDLISFVDVETGTPMTTDDLAYGQRLHTIAMPAHDGWRTPAAIELVGPRVFGYDIDYVPIGGTK